MKRLLLLRHAPTGATRSSAFPADEPLDDAGREAATALAGALPRHALVLCSPSTRCAETAAAAGLVVARVEPAIAECDFGAWAGRTLADLAETQPAGVGAWMTDPDAAPHAGESMRAFAARVAAWLDDAAADDGVTVAITHGGVVKAAVVRALRAPIDAFWRIDAAPLCVTELHAHDGRWTVTRVNAPVPA